MNSDGLQPCSREEADIRILLHVKDAMNSGYKDAIIRAVDTDVVVLAVAYFQDLENIGNLWIAFGTGKDFRYIPVPVNELVVRRKYHHFSDKVEMEYRLF